MRPASPRLFRAEIAPVVDWRGAMTRVFAGFRPLARVRRWLAGPGQPNMSLRLSVGLVAVLALLAMTTAR